MCTAGFKNPEFLKKNIAGFIGFCRLFVDEQRLVL